MLRDEHIEVFTTDLTTSGNAVGRYEGEVVFVEGALPGEKVRARVTSVKKHYAACKLEEILEPSPLRVKAPCPVFGRCGGCTLQDLAYGGQLEYKHGRVADCLARIAKTSVKPLFTLPSPREYHYRNKVTFALEKMPDSYVKIGFYGMHSHEVVDVSDCLLQEEVAARIMSQVRVWITRSGVSIYDRRTKEGQLRNIMLRRSSSGEYMLVLMATDTGLPDLKLLDQLLALAFPQVKSIVVNILEDPRRPGPGHKNVPVKGSGWLLTNIENLRFRVGPASFLQVNTLQTETLYRQLFRMLRLRRTDRVLDLFCGVGTISLLAAQFAEHVTGVEYLEEAVRDASFNADLNRIENAAFIAGDAGQIAEDMLKENAADVVIVNPPRSGLNRQLLETIARHGPRQVGYISCDPATLARDIGLFEKLGYTPEAIQPVDMFPQTTHVECATALHRQ